MEEEFNKELASYHNEMLSNAIRLCKNEADAQDLLQETMFKAWRYRDGFEMGTNMRAWLYTIMRNQFVNNYRKNKRFNQLVEEKEQLAGQTNSECKAEKLTVAKSEYKYLLEQLEGELHPDYLEVIILVDVFDKKYREAADILGVPLGTIMSRLYRGRKQGRQFLRENYDRERLLEAVPAEALEKEETAA